MKSKKKTDRNIPEPERIKIWVRAGGRCEICNEYLLQDSLTKRIYNFGEKAHNVGVGSGNRSPRSNSSLTSKERNKAENLILLCQKHHTMIDTEEFIKEYPPMRLREIKALHEKRIHYLTGLANDRKSVVLRMTNRIKEHSIVISDEQVRQALERCEKRFPEYLLSTDDNVEINLIGLPEKVCDAYWKIGKQIIDNKISRQIKPKVDEKIIRHISVFALARIPLLIYLGFRLGDKIPIDTYQKQRNANEDWIWCRGKKSVTFSYTSIQKGTDPSKIVLLTSISGKIHISSLPKFLTAEYSIYELTPNEEAPHRDIINSKKTLTNFKKSYQLIMRLIEQEHPQSSELLFFPALPLSAAVYVGRELLLDTSPALTIFDKEGDKYIKTFSINPKKRGTL